MAKRSEVMASSFVGSAALGAALEQAFKVLYTTVIDVAKQTIAFKPILQRLKSTLDVLDPLVKDIERFNKELDRPENEIKDLIEQMKKGEKHVRKYSKLPWWKNCMRCHYANKLRELEEALLRFFEVNAQALSLRNGMETMKGVKYLCNQMSLVGINDEINCTVPRPPDFIVGLDVSMKELKLQLQKEEVSMLLLAGPGGCGKTTLVKMLCQDEEIKGKYVDNIFFVRVTKSTNLKVIVRSLFLHKGHQVPEFQTDEAAIIQLEHFLNEIGGKTPVLLILDDVWYGSESLLEKFKFHIPDYKILVTSRTAFPSVSYSYNLKPLSEEYSMILFRHSAFLEEGSSDIPDEEVVKKVVKLCGGFPLALRVIGRSLCGEPAVTWRNRVKDWSSDHSILDYNSKLLECLKSSLEFSNKKVKSQYEVIMKECFMDLGSFPEDQRIRVAALIDMWAELYKLDEDRTLANLLEISARNLASLVVSRKDPSEAGSYFSEDFVLQHDLLRELAIHESSSSQETIDRRKKLIVEVSANNLPKWWTAPKQQHISAHLLSISTDEMFSSSWCNIQAPEVEVLVLNFQTKKYTLPKFVENMDKLKALIVTNYGFFPAELSNLHLLASVPYLKKIRLEKVSIHSLCKTPVKLMSLEKISLFMCNVGQIFRNCTIPISDCLPNLREINIDYCSDLVELPPDLCDIVGLEKLSITNCHMLSALPEGIGKLRNLKVLRLRSCTDLSALPESTRGLHNLSILDISGCLGISELPKHIGELCNLRELNMEGCIRLRYSLPQSTMDLNKLKLVLCDEERAMLWEPIKEFFEHGTQLEIKVAKRDINLNWLTNRF